ncbi:MAG: YjbE family putative metal transport protein [Rhodospirillaceae bacterium]
MDLSSLIHFDVNAFFMVIFVDIVLSGDNAIVIGMAAAALPDALRHKAIVWGIGAAVILRIVLAAMTLYLLQLTGIKLLGAFLLFAVCYEMWRDLTKGQSPSEELIAEEAEIADEIEEAIEHVIGEDRVVADAGGTATAAIEQTGPLALLGSAEFRRAMLKIIIADVSMSLDNVLAVAGVARENVGMLVFGLVLSVALMALGATLVAKLLDRHRWLGYVGLLIILYVTLDMGIDGWKEVAPLLGL